MARYLVTGANGGMGRAICRLLCERGFDVVGIDLAPSDEATPWRVCLADLSDPASLAAAFDEIGAGGRLDGVIHAAGLYDLGSLVEMGEDEFLRIFNVNLFGAVRVNRLALPYFNAGARVVLITSELAPLSPLPFTGIYAVTKAALDRYADALRMELQLLGYPVVAIRPGAVDTGMLPASTRALDRFCETTELYPVNADRFRKIVRRVEAKKIPPEKIAGLVLRALTAKRLKPVYVINRNPYLRLLNLLPRRMQLRIVRRILQNKKTDNGGNKK